LADSSVPISAGAGTNIDSQVPSGGDHRQVIVVGDPDTVAAVAEVLNAAPGASDYGVVVRQAGALPAGTNNIGDVDIASVPTLTKGTQGATGLTTQDLKDAGRQQVLLFWDYVNAISGTTALLNFTTGTRNAANLSAANNLQVSAGKTLRIQAVIVTVAATSATRFSLRAQIRQAATVANTSPVIWEAKLTIEAIGTLAADTPGHPKEFPIPDGLEVAAGQQITFTIAATAAQGKAAISIIGYEY
jgi:hypothetical protein